MPCFVPPLQDGNGNVAVIPHGDHVSGSLVIMSDDEAVDIEKQESPLAQLRQGPTGTNGDSYHHSAHFGDMTSPPTQVSSAHMHIERTGSLLSPRAIEGKSRPPPTGRGVLGRKILPSAGNDHVSAGLYCIGRWGQLQIADHQQAAVLLHLLG